MDTESLTLFVDVARAGSFAAVARARNIDPSVVSRIISQLESDVGARLFQRSTRRMALSEAGDQLLVKLAPLMEELNRVINEAGSLSREPSGTLRMTTSVTFGHLFLLPLIKEFRERYPRIKLVCVFSDDLLDLVANRIDLAIRLAPSVSGDLMVTKLMNTHYRVVASPDYLANAKPIREPRDLADHSCVLFPQRIFGPNWQFKREGKPSEVVSVAGDLVLSSGHAIREMAILGAGPALLADWCVRDALADGRLVDVFPDSLVSASEFNTAAWLVYPSRDYLPKKVRVMIDYLKEKINQQPRVKGA